MGEIAEMMLDGTLCEGCGEFMGDDVGYPRRCSSCSGSQGKKKSTEQKRQSVIETVEFLKGLDLPIKQVQ